MKNKLRDLRAERGWSQAVLGEKLDVSRQTVNAIETDRYDPSLPLAFKIAHKWRTIDRCEYRMFPANFHISGRITRMLGK